MRIGLGVQDNPKTNEEINPIIRSLIDEMEKAGSDNEDESSAKFDGDGDDAGPSSGNQKATKKSSTKRVRKE